jgi:hemerythrin-like domain-containing protein
MLERAHSLLASGLVRIHLVITRGVGVAREQSHAVAKGERVDASVATGFADYLHALVSVLRGHHSAEEEVIFPPLRDRFPDVPWDVLAEEHRAMVPVLGVLDDHAGRVRERPSSDTWASAAQALDRVGALWGPHRQREETHFTPPVVARVVPPDEQTALTAMMAAHSQQHTGPDYLVVPFLLFNLAGEDRRGMASLFPPVVVHQLMPGMWRDKWSAMGRFLLV